MVDVDPATGPVGDAPDAQVDVWEPGAPTLDALGPSAVFGAVIPLAVYFLVRHFVASDAISLAVAGAFPATWVAVEWVRKKALDPIGGIVLFGFLAGLLAAVALGGSAFVLKVRDSAFTSLFGLACFASLLWRRPIMFFLGKALSAGDDPKRRQAYDEMWTMPTVPHVFRVVTIVWGAGLIIEASSRVVLAVLLSTGTFLVASPAVAAVTFGGLFAFTVRYTRHKRAQSTALLDELGLTFPSVRTLRATPR